MDVNLFGNFTRGEGLHCAYTCSIIMWTSQWESERISREKKSPGWHRGEGTTKLKARKHHSTSSETQHERFDLEEPTPFQFSKWDKKLYRAIQKNDDARLAFQKLTTGLKAIHPSMLLFRLGAESWDAAPPEPFDGYEQWKDKWDGLRSTAKSLRKITEKMNRHINKSLLGPAPWPLVGYDRYKKQYEDIDSFANHHLPSIMEIIKGLASIIEKCCDVGREWLNEVQTNPRLIRQKTRTVMFMKSIKESTGRWNYEALAPLVNVGHRLTGQKEVTAHSLRALMRRHSR